MTLFYGIPTQLEQLFNSLKEYGKQTRWLEGKQETAVGFASF